MTQRARTDIELIRTLASLAVVTIHVAGGLYEAEPEARHTVSGVTSLVLNSASRFSVPVFFAISGWTFLVASPVASVRALRARVLRVLVPLLSWTVIYGLAANKRDLSLAVVPRIAWMFLTGTNIYHFWFIYAYVPLFLAMGLLTLFVRGQFRSREYLIAVGALLLLTASTSLFQLTASLGGASAATPSGWHAPPYAIAYAVLGAALLHEDRTSARQRLTGAAIYAVAVAASVAWSLRFGHVEPDDYGSIVTSAAAVGALMFLRGSRLGPLGTRVVSSIGRASFGLYLVHVLVLNLVTRLFAPVTFLATRTGWAGCVRPPIYVLATFTLSLVASLAWGRVPLLRRLLG